MEGHDHDLPPARREPAPGHLHVVQELINTYDAEYDVEALTDPATAARWLRQRGLLPRGRRLASADLARLIEVREALRALARANNGGALDAVAVRVLNRNGAAHPLAFRTTKDGAPALVPTEGGVGGAIAAVLATVHAAALDGTWSRLKACPASDCQWAFYDRSRNRSSTWCSMEVCGNRAKARAYRRRR